MQHTQNENMNVQIQLEQIQHENTAWKFNPAQYKKMKYNTVYIRNTTATQKHNFEIGQQKKQNAQKKQTRK